MSLSENESRKRPYSELQDMYAGPEDFMEAGARGFLITCIPDREELAIDQGMKMLRKACIKLYGGMKPPIKSTTALFSCGYTAVDFMDPETVTVIPHPEVKKVNTEQENTADKENENGMEVDKPEKAIEDTENVKDIDEVKEEVVSKEEIMETEADLPQDTDKLDKKLTDTDKTDKKPTDADKSDKKSTDPDKQDNKSTDGEVKKEGDEEEDKEKKEKTKEKGDGDKSKTDSQKSKSTKEEDRNRDRKKKKKEQDSTPKWPLMKATHRFKAYRTELRNIMFIKSDVPDPLALVKAIMDLLIDQQPLRADAINQLLPIQGICSYSYWELEVMAKRVLSPYFPEDLEEQPSFGILMYDKLSDPGTDVLVEIVRSAIWSINPLAWQSHPLTEPDVTIHLELIGSMIILSAMPHYMKYRQYSPFCVAQLGEGKREGPDEGQAGTDKDKSDNGRLDKKTRRGCRGGAWKRRDSRTKSSDDDERKDSKKSPKGKSEEKGASGDKPKEDAAAEPSKKKLKAKEESEEKAEEEGKEETSENKHEEKEGNGEKIEEAEEPSKEDEEKKTPQRRGGRRGASQKKKN